MNLIAWELQNACRMSKRRQFDLNSAGTIESLVLSSVLAYVFANLIIFFLL